MKNVRNGDRPQTLTTDLCPPRRVEAAASATFAQDANRVLTRLRDSLARLRESVPGAVAKPADLQRILKVDAKLAWQVYRFVDAPDLLPASTALPGVVAMHRFIDAARQRRVPSAVTTAVADAFDAFESFVQQRAGDRQAFNSMAGAGRPDASRAIDLTHKKAAFRCAAHFLGVQTETVALAFIIHPSLLRPREWDMATVVYKYGVRRLRADARIMLANVGVAGMPQPGATWFEPIEPDVDPEFVATLLPPFCSHASAETVVTRRVGGCVEMELAAGGVGVQAITNWAFGIVERNSQVLLNNGGPAIFNADISAAAQNLVIDVLVHDSLKATPTRMVPTHVGFCGGGPPTARADHQQLCVYETFDAIAPTPAPLRKPLVPEYDSLIRYACSQLRWDVDCLRSHRCRIGYPMLGTSLAMALTIEMPCP